MNPKTGICLVSLSLIAIVALGATPAQAVGACTAVQCNDVVVNNNFTITYNTCDNHGTIVQVGVTNNYCSGGNGTTVDVPSQAR